EGDNLAVRSERAPWHVGPTVLEALVGFRPAAPSLGLPLRLPVQDVYKFDERRIVAGRIESGRLAAGDRLLFSPSNKTARIVSLEAWNAPPPAAAEAGQSVGLTLDEPIFVERGEIASHEQEPPVETDVFRARLFWLGRRPLEVGARYKLKLATAEASVVVQSIERAIDASALSALPGERVERNAAAEITLRADRLLALDDYAKNPRTGRFVLV